MSGINNALVAAVIKYCSEIGTDPLLVQGAGGNVSWKEGDTLWVKASGTWLADASNKDIFVPVNLPHLRAAIQSGDFTVIPQPLGESLLRPSIETLLHALMPHRIVMHLHAIEILAHLVRKDCQTTFQRLLAPSINWALVDYHKPGADLAKAVHSVLGQKSVTDVIFLKNHGVVIGGNSVTDIKNTLNELTSALCTTPAEIISGKTEGTMPALFDQYLPVQDEKISQLALNTELFQRLNMEWVLYPDHAVFLGVRSYTYNSLQDFANQINSYQEQPELVFIRNIGVFVKSTFNKAKYAQLRCYVDILTRQGLDSNILALSEMQISELLNWDAEKYRQHLSA